MYKNISNLQDAQQLEDGLCKISKCTNKWLMKLNADHQKNITFPVVLITKDMCRTYTTYISGINTVVYTWFYIAHMHVLEI